MTGPTVCKISYLFEALSLKFLLLVRDIKRAERMYFEVTPFNCIKTSKVWFTCSYAKNLFIPFDLSVTPCKKSVCGKSNLFRIILRF